MTPTEGMKMEWISVEDRLPEEGVEVLTIEDVHALTTDNSHIEYKEYRLDFIAKFENEVIWARRLENEYDRVTHWMPLPEPPK